MSEVKPRGFGTHFWAGRIVSAAATTTPEEVGRIELVLEELIAQTRLDEALCCERALLSVNVLVPGAVLNRISVHRRDLRAAKRRGK